MIRLGIRRMLFVILLSTQKIILMCLFFSCAIFNDPLVGPGGLEPPTSRLSGVRSNRLSYRPFGDEEI